MRNRSFSAEANHCRNLAGNFVEGPEKPFLLSVADAFDDLAGRNFQSPESVIGQLGASLTLENLPAANTTRWTPRRKAKVVAAVAGGLLSIGEACERYSLTAEEFGGWQRDVELGGVRRLRVTRIQHFRESNLRPSLRGHSKR